MTTATNGTHIKTIRDEVDMDALAKLAEKIDVNKLIHAANQADAADLKRMLRDVSGKKKAHQAPPVNSDFYDIRSVLTPAQEAKRQLVVDFMEEEVRPIMNEYWEKGEFPQHIIPRVGEFVAEYMDGEQYQYPAKDRLLAAMALSMEMGRIEPSFSTFFGVHWGLAMPSIYMFGSEAQKAKWLPAMQRFEKIGSWALTEPEHGSDASMGLSTTAERVGDKWILNGQKKWSGNATFADVNVIWARDTADGQVKGFLVELGQPGYIVEKLEGKIAKRAVENVLITLEDCEVLEENRLPGANSFRDVSKQLAIARGGVSWEAIGVAMGAYEKALEYANQRMQFGKPITSFQMVQERFVEMLGHITAMQGMMLQLAKLVERDGYVSHERASLAKAYCSARMREVVAMARAVMGGNGILLEYEVARFFADAEAVYSYEGTYEMNVLITGRAITGQSAFV